MSYSTKPKIGNSEPYSEYFLEGNYFFTNDSQTPNNIHKTHTHKRKISQVSTLSFKSKNRNMSSNQKKNLSVTKDKQFSRTIPEGKKSKLHKINHTEKLQKKEFSLEKIRNIQNKKKYSVSNKKQKLKIMTQRKGKPKTADALTSRYIKIQIPSNSEKQQLKPHKFSHSSLFLRQQRQDQKVIQSGKNLQADKNIRSRLKLKDKNLKSIVNRCEKVITQYYQRLNQLTKENQLLKFQNQELKKMRNSTKTMQFCI